jgi:SAM-dependent methyltransferase
MELKFKREKLMSNYNIYGKLAQSVSIPNILQNGRYISQAKAEAGIPNDVVKKLKPQSCDTFLDVGCGLGLNLLPIAKLVNNATGCDHPNVIKKLIKQNPKLDVKYISGDFLEEHFTVKYSKILAYSVIPALPNFEVAVTFIDKILSILKPSGRALLGDLANIDKKKRFLKSERGKNFQEKWESIQTIDSKDNDVSAFATEEDSITLDINDKIIEYFIRHIRSKGFNAYILDQPQSLPFGNTREDILIVGPEYEDPN